MPNYHRYLVRKFSGGRLAGGIAVIVLTGLLVAGCTASAGRGGIYFAVIAFPAIAIGFGMMSKPFALSCRSCGQKASVNYQCVPFSQAVSFDALALTRSPEMERLRWFVQQAPLPDVAPSPFLAIQPIACPCGHAAYLQLVGFATGPAGAQANKAVETWGGEIGAAELHLLRDAAVGRWAATQAQRGFGDPHPPQSAGRAA